MWHRASRNPGHNSRQAAPAPPAGAGGSQESSLLHGIPVGSAAALGQLWLTPLESLGVIPRSRS